MSASEPKAFVDTNVLLYAYSDSSPIKGKVALDLVTDLWDSRRGCISIQVLQEFCFGCLRKRLLKESLVLHSVVSDLALWHVYSPAPSDVLNALHVQERYKLSFWDSMIVQCASMSGCSILYSEDLNAGQTILGMRIVNPFASLAQ